MDYPGHLLLINLGPIQDFIASARRCQDLWFGSWMLSDLSRTIALSVRAQVGKDELIFPASPSGESAVANKVLARVPHGIAPRDVAENARKSMEARLGLLVQAAFARFDENPRWKALLRDELKERQLADLLEYEWVCTPLERDADYGPARDRCEALLARRKLTRSWGQLRGQDGVPKSSLDGVRESVLTEAVFRLSESKRRNRYGVKGNEQLCAVAMLKRLGCELDVTYVEDDDPTLKEHDPKPWLLTRGDAMRAFLEDWNRGRPFFHSTSHMAAAPLLTRMAHRGAPGRQAVDTYINVLREQGLKLERRYGIRAAHRGDSDQVVNPWTKDPPKSAPPPAIPSEGCWLDGLLFYEGRLNEVIADCSFDVSDPPTDADKEKLQRREEAARTALRACLASLGVPSTPTRPTAYYALLVADGDSMGRAIDALGAGPEGREKHHKLATALDERFSPSCRKLVEGHGGSLIYAGGDDVLALLPLHTALACARALHTEFHEAVVTGTGLFPQTDSDGSFTPTLSVGIAVAHHIEPLQDVRERAKQAEKLAKKSVGKNSLVIIASKRGGGDIVAQGRWDEANPIDARLVQWGKMLADGDLPDGVAWHLEEVLAPFPINAEGRYSVGAPVVERLAARVLSRRRDGRGGAINDAVKGMLEATFAAARARSPAYPDDATAKAVLVLSEEVQMARLFLSAWSDAWGDRP